jgi:hypothetical protein
LPLRYFDPRWVEVDRVLAATAPEPRTKEKKWDEARPGLAAAAARRALPSPGFHIRRSCSLLFVICRTFIRIALPASFVALASRRRTRARSLVPQAHAKAFRHKQ